ncbi:MAG: carotenoid biosynthesis protein [Chloroflexota bacterium]|nr:carotenoid biosynthesis protein [Chloroflexota bacterium]
MHPLFLLLEVTGAVLFGAACWIALRRGRLPLLELVSAAAFGLLLEEGDQLIFETYHYSPDWTLVIDRAPVLIGLTWAIIIVGAMRITDALGIAPRFAPVVDALLAISLDLAFDAIAIRMGLWTWRDVGPTQGWFGVPAGNFYSWLFVTLGFSAVSRWVRAASRGRPEREWLQLLVPLPAFAILLSAIAPYAFLQEMLEPGRGNGLVLFALTLAVFVSIAVVAFRRRQPPRADEAALEPLPLHVTFVSRLAIHGFFLTALVVMGLAVRLPVLLVVALTMLALELPLAMWTARRPHRDADVRRAGPMIEAGR